MNYRDIAFSKAREYGLEIIENARPDEDRKCAWVTADDRETIYFSGSIENGCDMFTILHEIGHIVLELPVYRPGWDLEIAESYIKDEIEAWQFALNLSKNFDVTLYVEEVDQLILSLSGHIYKIRSAIQQYSPQDAIDYSREVFRVLIEDNPRIKALGTKRA